MLFEGDGCLGFRSRHHTTGSVAARVETLGIALTADDVDLATHATWDYGHLTHLGRYRSLPSDVEVFAGGPVEPQLGFVIHTTDYHSGATLDIDGHVAVTASREILFDIARHKGPKKSLIVFGYAGWAPGQLEGEMAQHAWFTAPEDPDLVFDQPRSALWQAAMARRTLNL
jgi:putative AlgH/UPF0301 family transcriptional regulator